MLISPCGMPGWGQDDTLDLPSCQVSLLLTVVLAMAALAYYTLIWKRRTSSRARRPVHAAPSQPQGVKDERRGTGRASVLGK